MYQTYNTINISCEPTILCCQVSLLYCYKVLLWFDFSHNMCIVQHVRWIEMCNIFLLSWMLNFRCEVNGQSSLQTYIFCIVMNVFIWRAIFTQNLEIITITCTFGIVTIQNRPGNRIYNSLCRQPVSFYLHSYINWVI